MLTEEYEEEEEEKEEEEGDGTALSTFSTKPPVNFYSCSTKLIVVPTIPNL